MRRIFLLLISLFLVLGNVAPASAQCIGQQPIRFAQLNWESGEFLTALMSFVIEKGYECAVKQVPASVSVLENALAQNDVDVIAEQWIGRSPVIKKALEEGTVAVVGDLLKGGATQGWYIPDYVYTQYPGLRTYQDLPKYKDLFKRTPGATKASFLNCPAGWKCEVFNTLLLRNTGLDKDFDNVHPGTGAALDAEIVSAVAQKKPIIFYYWQPTGLMAKYNFHEIAFPPYSGSCWKNMLDPNNPERCVSGFPVSKIAVAISTDFKLKYPDIVRFFENVQFTPNVLNRMILDMKEQHRSGEQQAMVYLRNNPEVWRKWVPPEVASHLEKALSIAPAQSHFFPQWSMSQYFNKSLLNVVSRYGEQFRHVSDAGLSAITVLENFLLWLPPWLIIVFVGLLAWHSTRRYLFSALCMLGLFLIGGLGLWQELLLTVSLLVNAVIISLVIGIPIGILLGRCKSLFKLLQPVLDVMQTMPSFVYLIPVLMLFGLGKIPGIFATIIYAIPPLIRLTALGVQEVPKEMIEVGHSFGSGKSQLLRWVVLPLAHANIMAGINQCVMMSLSMVVVCSMIGAPGLGESVLQSIQTLNIGQGIEAGGAIVILAIIIDRITQAYGRTRKQRA